MEGSRHQDRIIPAMPGVLYYCLTELFRQEHAGQVFRSRRNRGRGQRLEEAASRHVECYRFRHALSVWSESRDIKRCVAADVR